MEGNNDLIINIYIKPPEGKPFLGSIDPDQEFIGLINKAIKNGNDPIEAINYLCCLGSREVMREEYKIGVENKIGKIWGDTMELNRKDMSIDSILPLIVNYRDQASYNRDPMSNVTVTDPIPCTDGDVLKFL